MVIIWITWKHILLGLPSNVTIVCFKIELVLIDVLKIIFPGDYTSDQIGKLISHRAQHLEESIFQCTFCSFKCRIKQNYEAHVKIHSPEKAFKCEHCTKSFRLKQNLESHLLSHTSEKNLTCDSCGFHTKYLSHMIAHKRIHAGKTNQ